MPETEFENAPMAEYEDAMEYKEVNLTRCSCERSGISVKHNPDCPKFEDNSHAPDYPL